MATYSHSKISTYENCPYQYKLRYIEKKKPEIENTIEAFMGGMVHQTLEFLYKSIKFKKRIAKNILIKFYRDLWEKNYSDDILIVKAEKENIGADNYRKMGEKFISDYYDRVKPFDQMTILGLETTDRMTLPDGNQWHVRIDKLGCDDKGNYFVCDYKTNARMKDQEEADEDRQLALYSIWVKDKFKDAKSVKLIWHMLAFNKDAISERTDKQLEKLQNEVIEIIKEMESATEFPTNVTALCAYCGFKSECPSFKHEAELEKIEDVKKFKDDDGVKLVDDFSELKLKKKEIEEQEEKLKSELIGFAKQKGIDVVYGSNMKAGVRDLKKVILPENKDELVELLKKKGLWEEFVMLNYSRFNARGRKGVLDKDVMRKIEIGEDWRISLSKRNGGGEE
jgi:putative RecB family exonuclease